MDFLQFCANNPQFCRSDCNVKNNVLVCRQEEVNNMETKKNLIARVAKKVAENALRRDANSTTCVCIYQPKIPEKLKQFKNVK